MWKKLKLNNKLGFSLVEVMVAMGVLGAGALTYMQIQKNNVSANKRSEARMDVNNLARDINTALVDAKACQNTFSGINFSGAAGSTGTIADIKDGTTSPGRVIFGTGSVIENSINVTRYEYEIKEPLTAGATGEMNGEFYVSFFYQNANKALANSNTYEKKIEQVYKVTTDVSGNLITCFSDTDNIVTNNVRQGCEAIGGSLDPGSMLCDLAVKDMTVTYSIAVDLLSATTFEGISFEQLETTIIPFLNQTFLRFDGGNTMDGILVMQKPLVLNQNPLLDEDTVPKKYLDDRLTCPSGRVGVYVPSMQQVVCTNLVCNNTKTSSQEYMVGIAADGGPVCQTLVTDDGETCTTGKLKAQANGSVKYECCTASCSDAANYCSGTMYESSNECGLCTGTKPLKNASWSAWSDTGDYRNVGGCVGGLQQLEKRQTRLCDDAQECGGVTCSGNDERWVDAGTQTCTPPKACSSSCDCDHPEDVCESGYCINRSEPGTCIDGTHAKGDMFCRYLCIGGYWSCPLDGPPVCGAVTGACQGTGTPNNSNELIFKAYEDEVRNGCRTQYRDVYIDINVANFKRGNIYRIGQGMSFTAEANPGDTPQTVLQRIANKINAANMTYPSLCSGAGSTVVTTATVVSSNRLKYHINWQHQPGIGGSRSCNGLDELTCGSTEGCNWKTNQTNYCTGWNYLMEQGTCSGNYSRPTCLWSGGGGTTFGGGGYGGSTGGGYTEPCIMDGNGNCVYPGGGGTDPGCEYKYGDQASCNSSAGQADNCYWGSKQQACYGNTQASCLGNGSGCSWKAGPGKHVSCTSNAYESNCTSAGSACTWGPPQ